jgi:hypothetical protein
MTNTSKSFARETLDEIRSMLTDATTADVERLSPYITYGGLATVCKDQSGDYVTYVTYADYAALSAQLEAANARAEMLADSVVKARAAALMEVHAEIAKDVGINKEHILRLILDRIPADTPFPAPSDRTGKEPCGECRLQPGETCDICNAHQPAVPGFKLTPANMTVQEAAKVLLDLLQTPSEKAPIEPRCIEDIWAATFRESGFSAVTGFLRVMAGGRDE